MGSALATRLLAAGVKVTGVRRDVGALPPGVRPLRWDLAAPEEAPALDPGIDAVVFAVSPSSSGDRAYRLAYVEGPARVLRTLEERSIRPRRFVLVSSTGVYGQQDGEVVDEDSPVSVDGFRGRSLAEGERLVGDAAVEAVVVRLGGIYGPGRTGFLDRVLDGRLTYPPHPVRYRNRIHREDAAGALDHVLRLRDPAGTYIGVDEAPDPLHEVSVGLRALAGLPPLPWPGRRPSVSGRSRKGRRCSCRRLLASGYRFRFPSWREGYGDILRRRGQSPPRKSSK